MTSKGGRTHPPLIIFICTCLLWTLPLSGQGRFPLQRRQRPILRPGASKPARLPGPPKNANRNVIDQSALALLRKMIKPIADYAGIQVTEVTEREGQRSQQRIKGDTKGRIRVDFLSPANLEGDVMLIGPGQFRSYHRRTNVVDMALWPTDRDRDFHEQRMIALIRNRRVAVSLVGDEMIAGRSAAIVLLSAEQALGGAGGGQVKYWIDTETGVQLKVEKYDAQGRLLSRTYMTSIAVGPAAGVVPQDFEPGFLRNAIPNPLFPAVQFHSLEEARLQLPFRPVAPESVPMGFRLSGVWVFGPSDARRKGAGFVLLRYSDGVATFSLYEHLATGAAKAGLERPRPQMFRHSIQRWRASGPDGEVEVIYIGVLSPQQAQTVYNSLR